MRSPRIIHVSEHASLSAHLNRSAQTTASHLSSSPSLPLLTISILSLALFPASLSAHAPSLRVHPPPLVPSSPPPLLTCAQPRPPFAKRGHKVPPPTVPASRRKVIRSMTPQCACVRCQVSGVRCHRFPAGLSVICFVVQCKYFGYILLH